MNSDSFPVFNRTSLLFLSIFTASLTTALYELYMGFTWSWQYSNRTDKNQMLHVFYRIFPYRHLNIDISSYCTFQLIDSWGCGVVCQQWWRHRRLSMRADSYRCTDGNNSTGDKACFVSVFERTVPVTVGHRTPLWGLHCSTPCFFWSILLFHLSLSLECSVKTPTW